MAVLEKLLEGPPLNFNLNGKQYETLLKEVENHPNILFKEIDLSQIGDISGIKLNNNFESLLKKGKKENKRIIVAFTNPVNGEERYLNWARSIIQHFDGFISITSYKISEMLQYYKETDYPGSPFFNIWLNFGESPSNKSSELIFYLDSKLLELENKINKNLDEGKKSN